MTKIEVRPADPDRPGAGRLKPDNGIVWYAISPRRALVLCPPSQGDAVRGQIGDRFSLDVTGAWSVIAIAGPEAQTVLRRLTHLHHFPSGGEIAHVQGHVLERDGGYWVLVPQEVRPLRVGGGGRPRLGARRRRQSASTRSGATGRYRVKDVFLRKEIIRRPRLR